MKRKLIPFMLILLISIGIRPGLAAETEPVDPPVEISEEDLEIAEMLELLELLELLNDMENVAALEVTQ